MQYLSKAKILKPAVILIKTMAFEV